MNNITIFPKQDFKFTDKKLNIKFGIDPTSDKLHLGHLIPLMVIKDLQMQGHNIDIVLGTFTSQLGDPSEKDSMRPILSSKQTKENADSILSQVKRVLGEGITIHFNHTWFEELNCVDMIELLSKFTVKDLLSRDSFQKRMDRKDPIGLHELVVPILQGIDSVKLKTNIEVGGSDQLFNFGITREIQKHLGQEPEVCFMTGIINGTDGRKMSKSLNNCIFINDLPIDVFGKTMSISDSIMTEWLSVFKVKKEECLFETKKKLAFEITKIIWNENFASEALSHFEKVIQNKELPENIREIKIKEILAAISMINNCSKSEARRLIKQNGVQVNGEKIDNQNTILKSGDVIRAGKRSFAKII